VLIVVPGMNVNHRTIPDDRTALFWAVFNGDYATVDALLKMPNIDLIHAEEEASEAKSRAAIALAMHQSTDHYHAVAVGEDSRSRILARIHEVIAARNAAPELPEVQRKRKGKLKMIFAEEQPKNPPETKGPITDSDNHNMNDKNIKRRKVG
jgi:ankyrin repeat protein